MLPLAQQIIEEIESQFGDGNNAHQWSELAQQYPWYTTAWLGCYARQQQPEEAWNKIALQVTHPLRLQLITQPQQVAPFSDSYTATEGAVWQETEKASWSHTPTELEEEQLPSTEIDEPTTEENTGDNNETTAIQSDEKVAEVPAAEVAITFDLDDDVNPTVAATEAVEVFTLQEEAIEAPASLYQEEEMVTAAAAAVVDDAHHQETVAESSENPAGIEEKPDNLAGDTDLIFQPYHTVDYFAALGIKVDPNILPTSRFDTQLKSFTQWLKTMKRIDQTAANTPADPEVEAQAAQSVVTSEILTEAMAEVLVKQGKTEQALDIYAKLTLLHPEKTAFFAAQIENLKAAK